jgi:signal transduction histidine kinase
LSFIVEGTRRLELLAEGLSNYSVALGIEESSFRSVSSDILLRSALAKLGKELAENQAEVIYKDLPRVHGDPDRLSQVFENLLMNAVRHRGAATPRVQVAAEKELTYWRFAVRDNGPGVEEEYLERIFNPFERLSSGGSGAPGLGLTISREIVVRHGGRMWAESEIGAGSTFLFTLPARD